MSLLRRRMMMQQQEDWFFVTSVDGERIKVPQVMPKEFDPNGLSIHDKIFEEDGKRYLRKSVRDGTTGVWNLPDPIPIRPVFVPRTVFSPITSLSSELRPDSIAIWIDGIETVGWVTPYLAYLKDGIGICHYRAFNAQVNIYNPNGYAVSDVNRMLSNKPFRYAVPYEEIEIIEIR